jgi:hypothetical protein
MCGKTVARARTERMFHVKQCVAPGRVPASRLQPPASARPHAEHSFVRAVAPNAQTGQPCANPRGNPDEKQPDRRLTFAPRRALYVRARQRAPLRVTDSAGMRCWSRPAIREEGRAGSRTAETDSPPAASWLLGRGRRGLREEPSLEGTEPTKLRNKFGRTGPGLEESQGHLPGGDRT